MHSNLDNKLVFVTGGTGSIGSQVVKELLSRGASVIVYSRDQNKQHAMHQKSGSRRVTYINGDVCDQSLLMRSMKNVDFVVHCAASKHLGQCELNADSSIKINVEGTRNVLLCAQSRGVKKVLFLSTDKAVNPTSVMGATKFLAERLTLEFSKHFPCAVVRLGNVFGSAGSVVPLFMDRIKNKLPLIVNEGAIRYFITIKQAGNFICDRLEDMNGGEIFIKKMKIMSILQLAKVMAPVGYEIQSGTIGSGEKKDEHLFTNQEEPMNMGGYFMIHPEIGKTPPDNFYDEEFSNEEISEMLKGTV